MYLAVVILLMGVLPILSIAFEIVAWGDPGGIAALIGKWFVFWPVGVRLILAGIRQIANPAYTAGTIFGIDDPKAHIVVRELGFGTLSIGSIGVASIVAPTWITPAAVAGGLFYGLAGIQHALDSRTSRQQTIAMISDLAIFILLAIWLIALGMGALRS